MEPNEGTRLTKIRQKEHDGTKMTFGAKMSWANFPKTWPSLRVIGGQLPHPQPKEEIVAGILHCDLFNSTNSPELNPVENIFGLWKRHAERDVRVWTDRQDLLDKIAAPFSRIEANHVTAAMERCRTDVLLKVLQMGDI